MSEYIQVGNIRREHIIVYVDDKLTYDGEADEAPEEIRQMKYSKIDIKSGKIELYVYTK
jgi:hypothetical protein